MNDLAGNKDYLGSLKFHSLKFLSTGGWLCCFRPVAKQNAMVRYISAHFTATEKEKEQEGPWSRPDLQGHTLS